MMRDNNDKIFYQTLKIPQAFPENGAFPQIGLSYI